MALSQTTIDIVKATAPVVAQHGEAITTRMYEILFETHPELSALFKDASPDQHKKLALAVSAYATNIDNLGALEKAVEKMANTHVSANVKPEHYPLCRHFDSASDQRCTRRCCNT